MVNIRKPEILGHMSQPVLLAIEGVFVILDKQLLALKWSQRE